MAKSKNEATELLGKELKSLIPKLDSEGLSFLLEQAKIHLYNMQVDKLNKAAIADFKAAANKTKTQAKKGNTKAAPVIKSKETEDKMSIRGSESGSSFYLFYRNSNVMFSKSEMNHLVKIANGDGTDLEIRERLYNWIARERKDIFALVPFSGRTDERLKTFAKQIKKSAK